MAASMSGYGTGRSRDQSDWMPPSGLSGYLTVSLEITCGWISRTDAISSCLVGFRTRGSGRVDEPFAERHAPRDQALLQAVVEHRVDTGGVLLHAVGQRITV